MQPLLSGELGCTNVLALGIVVPDVDPVECAERFRPFQPYLLELLCSSQVSCQ